MRTGEHSGAKQPRKPSVMKHKFSEIPNVEIPRSRFNRSHQVTTTFDQGYLVPFFVDEVLPGDTFKLRTHGFSRLATPIKPIMDNMYMDTFYFFVPLRLLWDNFAKFMGEQDNPSDSTDYVTPKLTVSSTENSLEDYLGIPVGPVGLEVVSFYHRAYNLIYNEWFRDQNLQDSVPVQKGDGPDSPSDYTLLRRGKRHDYFTSCLPFPQKGDPVDLPITGKADVKVPDGNNTIVGVYDDTAGDWRDFDANQVRLEGGPGGVSDDGKLYADMSQGVFATINSFRQAIQVQAMLEVDARGGTRYIELVRSHFGVTSPDSRLQRPEYLGGGSTTVNINPVAVTSNGLSGTPGTLGAYGVSGFSGHGFNQSFTEHGVVIGLVSVRADLKYQRGLNRMFTRDDRLDYFWPKLSQLGEQAVLNQEIYAKGDSSDQDVFGYQERYAEYRYKPSTVHGMFRSDSTAPLDVWHLAHDFDDTPLLNDGFIQDDSPVDRVISVTDEPHFIADFYHDLDCTRPMPLYGVPAGIGRF